MLFFALLLKIISSNLHFLDDRPCRKFLTIYLMKSTGMSPNWSKFCSDKVYHSFWLPLWVRNQTGEVFVTWIDGKSTQNKISHTHKNIWIYENVKLLLISFHRCQFSDVMIGLALITSLAFYAVHAFFRCCGYCCCCYCCCLPLLLLLFYCGCC